MDSVRCCQPCERGLSSVSQCAIGQSRQRRPVSLLLSTRNCFSTNRSLAFLHGYGMNLLAHSSLPVAGSRTPKKLHFESIRIMSATRPHTPLTDEPGAIRHQPADCHFRVRSRANPSAQPRERLRTGLWVEAAFSTANSVWRSQTNGCALPAVSRVPLSGGPMALSYPLPLIRDPLLEPLAPCAALPGGYNASL